MFRVDVSNVGTVYRDTNEASAREVFEHYARDSKVQRDTSFVYGETVTLTKDHKPIASSKAAS